MTTPPSAGDKFNICVHYRQAPTLASQHTIYFTVLPRLMMLTVMRAIHQRLDILSSEDYMFYYQNAIVSPLVSVGKLGLEQGVVTIHLPFSNLFEGEMHFNLVSAVLAKNRFVINADLGLYDDQRMDAAIARTVAPDEIGRVVEDGLLPFKTYQVIKGRRILFFNHVLFTVSNHPVTKEEVLFAVEVVRRSGNLVKKQMVRKLASGGNMVFSTFFAYSMMRMIELGLSNHLIRTLGVQPSDFVAEKIAEQLLRMISEDMGTMIHRGCFSGLKYPFGIDLRANVIIACKVVNFFGKRYDFLDLEEMIAGAENFVESLDHVNPYQGVDFDESLCMICLEPLSGHLLGTTVPCGHPYHQGCWRAYHNAEEDHMVMAKR
jgi:hypothetical protein